jgi:tetratricopeptide (TPR) repeat protein
MRTAELIIQAIQHHRAGDLDLASRLYEQVLAADPSNSEALHLLGVVAFQKRRLPDAEEFYRRALKVNPAYHHVYNNLGILLCEQGRLEEAYDCYRSALRYQPDDPGTLNNLGLLHAARGEPAQAVTCYRKGLVVDPGNADLHNNLGNALRSAGKAHDAMTAFDRALEIRPEFPEAWNNMGNACADAGDGDRAFACYQKALELQPRHVSALNNLGKLLRERGDLREAREMYIRALEVEPASAEAHWGLANVLLLQGDFVNGWREFEWRWQLRDCHDRPPAGIPRWTGQPLTGKTILVWTEQGLGDAMQFIRLVHRLNTLGARVVVECPRELTRLFASVHGIAGVITRGDHRPPADLHCPLMSIPAILQTNIPPGTSNIPYFHPPSDLVNGLSSRMRPDNAVLRVGLVWSGSPTHENDRRRSMSLRDMLPLSVIDDVAFYSLQRGPAARQIDEDGFGKILVDLTPVLGDMLDTAAAILGLDIVITVDTAVAHLAGALGKPVWVMLPFAPDWRWMLHRDDSPWYPTVRLFRQPTPGDWEGVIGAVAGALRVAVSQGHVQRALDLQATGRGTEAAVHLEKAAHLVPENADTWNLLGVGLYDLGMLDHARTALERAVSTECEHAEGYNNLGNVLRKMGKPEQAQASYRRALALRPDFGEAHYNLGASLCDVWDLPRAEEEFRHAIRLRPDLPLAWNNLGFTLYRQGKAREASDACRRAIALDPENLEAHWNLSHALLALGHYEEGWREFEWRWRKPEFQAIARRFFAPRWTGQDVAGRRVLIVAEQGYGDMLFCIRYATLLADRGAHVTVEAPQALTSLMATVPGVADVVPQGSPLPLADYCIPVMSLPGAFGTRVETIPAPHRYVVPEFNKSELWRQRVCSHHQGMRVGFVWAGSTTNQEGAFRSLRLEKLGPLFDVQDITFVSLQVGEHARDLRNHLGTSRVLDSSPFLRDFADTAALIDQLDLVITIDTAVAHLAGALGKRVWTMLPVPADWRWMLDRTDTPWYPSMRLYRQRRSRTWDDVVDAVVCDLIEARTRYLNHGQF